MYINQVKRDWLEGDVAPSGSSRWLALMHKLPDAEGVGGIESSVDRAEITSWLTETLGEFTIRRSNVLLTSFTPVGYWVPDVVGWALFDASSGGVMKAARRFRNTVLYTFKPNELIRQQPGDIQLILDPAPIVPPGVDPDMEICTEVQTFDNTPLVVDLGTIADEEARHVVGSVVGTGYDGDEGKHYYRQFHYSFERLESDAGLQLWILRDLTPDAETRFRFGSAVATVGHDGTDKVQVTVTGEAGTSVNWKICWKGIGPA